MEKPAPDEQPWQWIMSVTELLMALTCSHMPLDGPHMPLEPSGFPSQHQTSYTITVI